MEKEDYIEMAILLVIVSIGCFVIGILVGQYFSVDTSCITKVNDNYCECGRSCE